MAADTMGIRPAREGDRERMLEVWELAVRATHHFLMESNIEELRPLVADGFANDEVAWWVLVDVDDAVAGFLGYTPGTVDALFIDPAYHRHGGGRMLIEHAQALSGGGALSVDVNEQNDGAVRFYEATGFAIVDRSPTDEDGRPFPILHMRRPATTGAGSR